MDHSLPLLLRQHIGALPLACEDLDHHDGLRLDPACPDSGQDDRAGSLERTGCYPPDIRKPETLLIKEGLKAITPQSRKLVLDFEASDHPQHGAQKGVFFRRYYRNYC